MRLMTVILVVLLAGCAHTPWGYNFTRNGEIPQSYRADKNSCSDLAWAAAKDEASTSLSDVFLYLYEKQLLHCMKEKGYQRVDAGRVHYRSSHETVRMGSA